MNFKRFWAVFNARNIEFFRDKSSLGWNLFFPVLLLAGFSIVFSGDGKSSYKVGIVQYADQRVSQEAKDDVSAFKQTRFIDFVDYSDQDKALIKLDQHAIDLVIDPVNNSYWVNENSPKSYLVEKILLGAITQYQRQVTTGKAIRYVDWVLPGILGMNMMFSCLFGVGYVIVRYRKNAVLKRLKATPLSALEFVSAQLVSRLFIVMFMSSVVYIGCNFFFDFYMLGSYFDLLLIGVLGAFSLISLGLLVASRSKSEELIGGLLNLTSWPMMILSGVWFSLEGAPDIVKVIADFLPLTHIVSAARMIITEGATLSELSYHIGVLSGMSLACLLLGAYFFSWNAER